MIGVLVGKITIDGYFFIHYIREYAPKAKFVTNNKDFALMSGIPMVIVNTEQEVLDRAKVLVVIERPLPFTLHRFAQLFDGKVFTNFNDPSPVYEFYEEVIKPRREVPQEYRKIFEKLEAKHE